jgi:hypothetical protein
VVPQDHRIPRPKYRDYKPTCKDPRGQPQAGLDWWNGLNDWGKSQIHGYVYRDHPILKLRADDTEHQPGSNPNIEKIAGETFTSDDDLLRRYGCGDYHIRLNDEKGTVTIVWFKGLGSSDYRSNPPTDPRISDIEQVDLAHPANASYVAYLRGVGKLPNQQKMKQDEEDMATIEVTKEALKQNRELTEKLIEGRQSGNNELLLGMMQRMLDQQDRSGSQATEETRSLRQELKELAASGNGGGFQTMMPLLLALIERSGKGNGESTELVQMRQQHFDMLNRLLEAERARSSALETRLESRIAAPAPATNSMEDAAAALIKYKELTEKLGLTGKDENPIEEAAGAVAPKWMRPIIPLLPLAGQALQAIIAAKMGPQQPNVPPGFPVPHQPNPQPQPAAIAPPAGMDSTVAKLISSIAHPLISSVHQGINGQEFADWFIDTPGYGLETFKVVAGWGEGAITEALLAHPETAPSLASVPPPTLQGFVRGFVNATVAEEPAAEAS